MPNRIIREGILTSEKVAKLGWPEEVFYRRLQSIVDDYGRYEANTLLLRSKCYPLQVDDVRVADITRWMAACQKAGLLLIYAVKDKQYLEITNFEQQRRTPSKWPAPPADADLCNHLLANDCLDVSVSVVGVVSEVEKKGSRKRSPVYDAAGYHIPEWLDATAWKRWCKDRTDRKKPITEEGARQQVAKLDVYRLAGVDPVTVLNHAIEGGHQGLFYPMPGQDKGSSRASKHGAAAAAIFDADQRKEPPHA